MDSFQPDKCLCPVVYQGVTITSTRYRDMAFSLYQLLAQPAIIPNEYTDLRNIIDLHANSQDGYQVLYDIMENIHPRLDPDAEISEPVSTDCTDIHDYYRQFDSYLTHERYAGRTYTAREQIKKFLKGLDSSYTAGVTKVRSLMESWKATDTQVPDALQLAKLPKLIQKTMEDDDNGPVIRTIRDQPTGGQKGFPRRSDDRGNGDKESLHKDTHKYVDVRCPLCLMFGHSKYDCDKMTIYLALKANETKLDEKLKSKIQSNFAANEDKRRLKKVNKLRGTVRQLYTAGQYEAGDQLWNDLLPPTTQYNDARSIDGGDLAIGYTSSEESS